MKNLHEAATLRRQDQSQKKVKVSSNMWQATDEDVAYFKVLAQIKNEKSDEYIKTMLPLLAEHVAEYVYDAIGEEVVAPISDMKANYKVFIAKALQHNMTNAGVKGRSMGTVSYTYNIDFPKALYAQYLPRKRAKFHAF